jgi:hypothetical protein
MNSPKEKYICKIHGICLPKPSQLLEFSPFFTDSSQEKSSLYLFFENKNEKAVPKLQIYHIENPYAI